jgi:adenylate kinase family enzyme
MTSMMNILSGATPLIVDVRQSGSGPDTPEAVEGRLRDYHDKTRPILDLFRAKEVIVAVDATGPVEQIQAAIREQLGVEMSSV